MIRFAQQRKDCDTICQHICIIVLNLRALFFFIIIVYLKKIPFFYGVILIKEIKP
jgi:hypothetical protein